MRCPTRPFTYLCAILALLGSAAASAASLSGTADCADPVAVPADAVFEAVLEDVSRADAKSTVLSRARLGPAGKPPFAFKIEYDAAVIAPGHRYAVRATVRHEGKLLLTTDRHYPLPTATDAAPLQLQLRAVGHRN